MTEPLPPDLAVAVRLGGEMGRRFADFDWAAHPLGPPRDWPLQVQTLVATALTSQFPIVLWLGGEDLHLVYNDGYIPMLGDKHPAALGRPGRQVWWDIWPQVGPMLAGVVETGESTWSDDLMLPLVTEGWAQERYFTFSYSPIILDSGRVDGVFCAVAETTQRVLGERRLLVLNRVAGAVMDSRTVGEALEAMVSASGEGHPDLPFIAIYLEGDGRGDGQAELHAASARVAGLLPHRLGAQQKVDTIAPSLVGLDDLAPGIAAAFDTDPPTRALVFPIGDGRGAQTSGYLMAGLNPLRPVDEQYRGFVRLLADQLSAAIAAADSYHQQARRAEQLAELDRAKTAFLTNVSHEFRTPLTLLLGPIEDAIEASAGDAEQSERLVTARRNGLRLLRLVNSLLEFSRIEAGRPELALQTVDLGALTAQISSSFAGLCEKAGIALDLECDPVAAAVDVDMWETVVSNLLSNAVKFTHQGSITVQVQESATGEGVVARISDTGVGVTGDDLSRLFERFYRAGNTGGRSVEGSGIGLSLVRSLVELHGGTVGIESTPGVGTTVTVTLPSRTDQAPQALPATVRPGGREAGAYVAEAEQWLRRPAESSQPPDDERALVLIADDNADMRGHLERILSQRWNILTVGDGQAALEAVRRHRPDLVVTDVMMPVLDGFGFVQAIRQDPALAETPVLMLSARAGVEAAGDGFAAGADDYLAKPFTSAELLHRVQARLDIETRHRVQHARNEVRAREGAALAEFYAAINSADSVDALLAALLSSPLAATGAAFAVCDPADDHLTLHYAGNVSGEFRSRYHRVALDAPVPIAEAAASGEPMSYPDSALLDDRFEQVVRDSLPEIQAGMFYPLHDTIGEISGAIALLWSEPRQFDDAARDLVSRAAVLCGQSLSRINAAAAEQRISTGFQDHLLDLDRSGDAAVLAAVYQPASEAMRVGGDWYQSIPLMRGRVSACVGDVVGHGLPAATVMSQLRAAVAATALTTPEPERVLATVQRYAATVPGGRCSTLAYAAFDSVNGAVDYLCAGHPYPLLVNPDGSTEFLEQGRMPPLAAFNSSGGISPGHHRLAPGGLLILYTDGLIERHGESLDDGFARLAAAASECASLPAETVCAKLLRELSPPGGYTDDVVVMALRPCAVTDSSFLTVIPAAATELAPLRQRLSGWMRAIGAEESLLHNVLIAAGEALVNAIEHGSGMDASQSINFQAFVTGDGWVTVSVTDTGQWRGDSAASRRTRQRGRGLTLMHGMAAAVDTVRSRQGTTVTLHFPYTTTRSAAAAGGRP